jgi:hypothetical protein
VIIDATCAPQNIKYPQDINLLDEAREKLEKLIKKICKEQNWYVPRMYRKNARKDYLALSKCRKRSAKKARSAIKKQLNYVCRDLRYVEWFLEQDNVVDQIYRNRDNINFCKKWHIRLSSKALGRPKKTPVTDKKTEYQDNVDRIEVERKLSLAKRKFGLSLIRTKLENTTKSSILLAIIAMNVDRLTSLFIRWLFWVLFGKPFAAGC